MVQHCLGKKHRKNVLDAPKKEQVVKKIQSSVKRMSNDTVGTRDVLLPHKVYRCGALYACAKSNIPIDYLFDLEDWLGFHTSESLGHRSDLVRQYVKACVETIMFDLKRYIKAGCFDEFSTTFDGTPSFAEAEAIILRIVSKNMTSTNLW